MTTVTASAFRTIQSDPRWNLGHLNTLTYMTSVNLNSVLLSYLYDCFALKEVVLLLLQICGSFSVHHTLNCTVEILLETDMFFHL